MTPRLLTYFLTAAMTAHAGASLPHYDLDMTTAEIQRELGRRVDVKRQADAEGLQEILDTGKHFYEWVGHINQFRTPENKISLSGPQFQAAYPIESPRAINPTLIQEEFDRLRQEMPASLTPIVFEGAELTENPPLPDAEFAAWGRRVDKVYQAASRWLLLLPYKETYKGRKRQDIRGYYYLGKEEDLAAKLFGFTSLPKEQQDRYTTWLVGLCTNGSSSETTCKTRFRQAVASDKVADFYNTHEPAGKRTWDAFFVLGGRRSDVRWEDAGGGAEKMTVPFRTVEASIRDFLVGNIEDEWRVNSWQLKLDFTSTAAAHIVFTPGATPNVNGLAGDRITMDKNQPLTEYSVQWTIRHEFGHVLGLPDCYLEFYDVAQEAFVSYQLDTSDLMCSRRGKLKEIHYNELRKAYRRL